MEVPAQQDPYQLYATDPTPENLGRVVDAYEPYLRKSVAGVAGQPDPFLLGEARFFAAQAVRSYDPASGANLRTWMGNHLQQLRRSKRLNSTAVRVPERTHLDALHLHRKTVEWEEQHGRSPDTLELSDASGFSPRKIAKIRKTYRPVVADSAIPVDNPHSQSTYDAEALDYVYAESDHANRRIMDGLMGYAGHPILQAKEIAAELGMHPAQVSRRLGRLRIQLNRIITDLEAVAG